MGPALSHSHRLVPLLALGLAAAGGVGLGGCSGPAEAVDVRVAGSVCEAHELRAWAAEAPHRQIEIPKEFDQKWPTAEACRSYAAAADPDAPGPLQPIPFSHKHHAGTYQIACLYCHAGTDVSRAAGVPSVQTCMGCHSQFPPSYDEFEGIRVLKEHWKEERPIEWEQIHRLPEHVKFRHNRHVAAGIDCTRCHGPVQDMDKLHATPDTVWWPWLLPSQKLEMGWCIQCHRKNQASQDCLTCHY